MENYGEIPPEKFRRGGLKKFRDLSKMITNNRELASHFIMNGEA